MHIRFYRRRGAAEHQFAVVVFGAQKRDVKGIVARRSFADIAAVMFFVDDDDADIFERREHRAARADDNFRLARTHAPPFVEPFPRRKTAVQNSRRAAEAGAELGEHLRRQGNFGYEKNGAFAFPQILRNEVEIDFRFAAARYAVQKLHPLVRRSDCRKRAFLFFRERMHVAFRL